MFCSQACAVSCKQTKNDCPAVNLCMRCDQPLCEKCDQINFLYNCKHVAPYCVGCIKAVLGFYTFRNLIHQRFLFILAKRGKNLFSKEEQEIEEWNKAIQEYNKEYEKDFVQDPVNSCGMCHREYLNRLSHQKVSTFQGLYQLPPKEPFPIGEKRCRHHSFVTEYSLDTLERAENWVEDVRICLEVLCQKQFWRPLGPTAVDMDKKFVRFDCPKCVFDKLAGLWSTNSQQKMSDAPDLSSREIARRMISEEEEKERVQAEKMS